MLEVKKWQIIQKEEDLKKHYQVADTKKRFRVILLMNI